MSEHAWVHDNLTAYVAGGLDAAEGERVEAHAAECETCAATLRDARALDHRLDALFAAARPAPALEDRVIQALRKAPLPARPFAPWTKRLAWGAAATVALGATGAGVSQWANPDALPLPGVAQSEAVVVASQSPGQRAGGRFEQPPSEEQLKGIVGETLGTDWMPANQSNAIRSFSADGRYPSFLGFGTPAAGQSQITDGTSNSFWMADGSVRNVPSSSIGYAWNPNGQGGFGGGLGGFGGGGLGGMMGMAGGGPPTGMAQNTVVDGRTTPAKRSHIQYGTHQPRTQDMTVLNGEKERDEESEKTHLDPSSTGPAQTTPPPSTKEPPAVTSFNPDQHRAKLDEAKTDPNSDNEGKDQKENKKSEGNSQQPGRTEPAKGESKPPQSAPEQPAARKVIRSGDIQFEVPSFDSAAAAVTKLVTNIKGAFVATVNSDKLPNGKVQGSLVVRVPPEHLDGLVLDLRRELGKDGELKGLKIGSQDITKQYYDLESRLKAAKTMQERLLQIIKDGKGEIKQLLEAEKELGVWRTKIEEFEGEIRYYNSVVALSTLTVSLAEKEIRAAAVVVEHDVVDTGVEVEDVDKAREQTLAAVADAKGSVTQATMKQFQAGQYNATLVFEVPADQAGPLRDRLRQIGNMVRLEIKTTKEAEGGQATRDAKVRRGDTQFLVSLYNVTTVAARETAKVDIAAPDVPAAYRALQDAVAKVKGRVITAQLDENDRNNVTAQLDFDVRRADEPAIQNALTAAGEIVSRNVVRAQMPDDSTKLTDAKVQYQTRLHNVNRIRPRELFSLRIEVADVDATAAVFAAQVKEVSGRVLGAETKQEPAGRMLAAVAYDVPLTAAPVLVEQLKKAGTVRAQESTRNPQAPEGKLAVARVTVWLSNAEPIVAKDEGLWPQVRTGLGTSLRFLLFSLSWLIFGVLVILPWALIAYGIYRLARRLFPSPPPSAPAPATPAA
jgi:hypothetical protein